jgi:hypothetical protein
MERLALTDEKLIKLEHKRAWKHALLFFRLALLEKD